MPRKISSGKVGRSVLGDIFAQDNSIRSVETNANIVFEPDGTGTVESNADLQLSNGSSLRLADDDSSAYVALKSPATLSATYTLTFPANDGDAGQSLLTDGDGNLSWSSASVAVTNQTADPTTYYPTITTSTSGTLNAISTSDTKLTYQPSSGRFSSVELRATGSTASSSTSTGAIVVTGGAGIGGQLTATTIVETSSIALKENIVPIANALDRVLALKGVTYDRIDNNEHESGLIAEWTDEVLPELVSKDENGEVVGIKYSKLTAYLIEAVKSLKFEIDLLKGTR